MNNKLTFEKLIDGFHQIEKFDQRVISINMSKADYTHLRKHKEFRSSVEVAYRDVLTGVFGTMCGAQIYVSRDIENPVLTGDHGRTFTIVEEQKEEKTLKNIGNVKLKFIMEEQ